MTQLYREPDIIREIAPFEVDGLAMPYPEFMPRLYNFCMALGFRRGFIMPSRAFCSDENQGWPIILLTKHFGTFPFNHGRVGGIMAVDRHGPHANHGDDSVIVQASHVGYDPDTGRYGECKRPQLTDGHMSKSCGKITHVITPYLEQYQFARQRIFLHRDDSDHYLITVKNSFIDFASHPVKQGLVLRLPKIVESGSDGMIRPLTAQSSSQTYEIAESFRKRIDSTGYKWKRDGGESIGELLTADLFYFREDFHETGDFILLEKNLIEFMPQIVTSSTPPLRAAKINIQLEFSRVVESIRRGTEYRGKNLLYITGLNVDISAYKEFPATTYFVPWAAHVQLQSSISDEYLHPIEQQQLFAKLMEMSKVNKDQVDLKEKIGRMLTAPRFDIRTPE